MGVPLAIGGIAVAGGRVDPVWLGAFTCLIIILGAALCRGVTALLGWERLVRIAFPLRAHKPLEREETVAEEVALVKRSTSLVAEHNTANDAPGAEMLSL